MRKAKIFKTVIDVLMTLALLFLMGYQFWGDAGHEIAGTLMMVFFIAHNILNAGFYRVLFKGKYSAVRVLRTVVNILLLVSMILSAVSGIMMSRYVFFFLGIESGLYYARLIHLSCAYWSFILAALHLGLHWNMMTAKLCRRITDAMPKKGKTVLFIAALLVALAGIAAFIHRNIFNYLFLRTMFAFIDPFESKLFFYAEYLCMMGTFIFIAHYAMKKLMQRKCP